MGAVYVAEQVALHKVVAIKVIRAEVALDPEVAERFAREAIASAALEHPHVVGAFDYGTLPASLGADLTDHRSRALTRDLLANADIVFGLTRDHVAAIIELDPTAADRVYLLDPAGADVPDPIGAPQGAYDQTAARLADLIAARLAALEGAAEGGRP